jgi:hypothetical protein
MLKKLSKFGPFNLMYEFFYIERDINEREYNNNSSNL